MKLIGPLTAACFFALAFSAGMPLVAAPNDKPSAAKPAPAGTPANAPRPMPTPEPESESVPVRAGEGRDYNRMVLDAIRRMPSGGGYSANSAATSKLVEATALKKIAGKGLGFRAQIAQPSYCSGATYLVFLTVVDDLVKSGRIKPDDAVLAMLPVARQMDGAGIWGRWNANGPGTGRFFYQTGLGSNHIGLDHARAGDFLKIWWNEHVGKRERGHLVIFIGMDKTAEGEPGVRFWSSNEPDGMGEKVVALTKVKRALISRLEHPENLNRLKSLEPKDKFLADMLVRDCSEAEYLNAIGLGKSADAEKAPGGGEKIVVKIDEAPAGADRPPAVPGRVPNPAALPKPADAATLFMAGTRYATFSDHSKAGIIELVQMRLRYDGVSASPADGQPGNATTASLKAWQVAAGLPASGVFDEVTQLKMGLHDLQETKAKALPATVGTGAPDKPVKPKPAAPRTTGRPQ